MSPSFTKFLLEVERGAPRAASKGVSFAKEKGRVIALLTAAEQSDASIRPYTMQLKKALKEAENDNQPVQRSSSQR